MLEMAEQAPTLDSAATNGAGDGLAGSADEPQVERADSKENGEEQHPPIQEHPLVSIMKLL